MRSGQLLKKAFYNRTNIRSKKDDLFSLTIRPVPEDLVYVRKNIKVARRAIAYTVARVMAYIAVDLLAQALPRTPYDTGELRRSGTATLSYQGYETIGKGTKRGLVNYNYGAIDPKKAGRASRIYSNVFFTKINEKGQDIAYWTHEILFPYEVRGSQRPAARQEGTGPKYLELPFRESMPRYRRLLNYAYTKKTIDVITGIGQAVQQGKKGQATRIKLIESKIRRLGYWG